ncbi:hypothetical protein OESDEN_17920 [Oesophagostomum dentatum]|uniref:Uncharacterized protein n=1 Tax=Oesophagostomum dentatum TaxID=61180 RepID=A0A0B1SER1_OESDE|nr:hypothetical protein OESDEN_17920 [Oesophagostomum dentatum]
MTGILSSVAILLFIASIFFGCYLRRVALHPETGIIFRKQENNSLPSISSSTFLVKEPPRSPDSLSVQEKPTQRAHRPASSILRPARSPFRAYETSA